MDVGIYNKINCLHKRGREGVRGGGGREREREYTKFTDCLIIILTQLSDRHHCHDLGKHKDLL